MAFREDDEKDEGGNLLEGAVDEVLEEKVDEDEDIPVADVFDDEKGWE